MCKVSMQKNLMYRFFFIEVLECWLLWHIFYIIWQRMAWAVQGVLMAKFKWLQHFFPYKSTFKIRPHVNTYCFSSSSNQPTQEVHWGPLTIWSSCISWASWLESWKTRFNMKSILVLRVNLNDMITNVCSTI